MKWLKYALTALLILLMVCGVSMRPKSYRRTFFSLDTVITLTAYGKHAESGLAAAQSRIEEIHALLNAYSEDSDIGRINSAPSGVAVRVSEETFSLICRAKAFSEMTDGVFDFTLKPLSDLWGIGTERAHVPAKKEIEEALGKTGWQFVLLDESQNSVTLQKEGMGLDLGGIAKGYASDEAVRVLKEAGVENACLDLGGNIAVMGERPLGVFESIQQRKRSIPFTVGLQNPQGARGEIFQKLTLQEDGFVVTSGDYERYFEENGIRYHHIFDPRTGYPAKGDIHSVTVLAKDGTTADALSTTFFILGREADGIWKNQYETLIFAP